MAIVHPQDIVFKLSSSVQCLETNDEELSFTPARVRRPWLLQAFHGIPTTQNMKLVTDITGSDLYPFLMGQNL